jgi:uncharacterized membrane protein YtjA (UPF0391 family)
MVSWPLIFVLVAVLAGVFGFGGLAGGASWIGQILFILFLALFVATILRGRKPPVS